MQLSLLDLPTPTMERLDLARCEAKIINYETARFVCNTYHYAKRTPQITVAVGMFVDGVMAGMVSYGIPASSNVLNFCGEQYAKNALELNRLFVHDWSGSNSESWLIGQSFKILESVYPQYFLLISYADTTYDHVGYIYQATNWYYTGKGKGDREYQINGKHYHRKNVYNEFGTSSIVELQKMGHKVTTESQGDKHR